MAFTFCTSGSWFPLISLSITPAHNFMHLSTFTGETYLSPFSVLIKLLNKLLWAHRGCHLPSYAILNLKKKKKLLNNGKIISLSTISTLLWTENNCVGRHAIFGERHVAVDASSALLPQGTQRTTSPNCPPFQILLQGHKVEPIQERLGFFFFLRRRNA